MEVSQRDIENIRRISEQVFGDKDYIEIEQVKDTEGDVMVTVESVDGPELGTRNAFAGSRLRHYHDEGYVAVAVGGGDERHSAWFERADALDFGDPEPNDEYELRGYWRATVGDTYVSLQHDGHVVAHVPHDGWLIDRHITEEVIPAGVASDLEEVGFQKADLS